MVVTVPYPGPVRKIYQFDTMVGLPGGDPVESIFMTKVAEAAFKFVIVLTPSEKEKATGVILGLLLFPSATGRSKYPVTLSAVVYGADAVVKTFPV
jgi:hypothetical protein